MVTYRKREILVCGITLCSGVVSQAFCTLFVFTIALFSTKVLLLAGMQVFLFQLCCVVTFFFFFPLVSRVVGNLKPIPTAHKVVSFSVLCAQLQTLGERRSSLNEAFIGLHHLTLGGCKLACSRLFPAVHLEYHRCTLLPLQGNRNHRPVVTSAVMCCVRTLTASGVFYCFMQDIV